MPVESGQGSQCSDLLRAGHSGDHTGGGEIFRMCPDLPWGASILLYKGYQVFPEDKAAWAWNSLPTPK